MTAGQARKNDHILLHVHLLSLFYVHVYPALQFSLRASNGEFEVTTPNVPLQVPGNQGISSIQYLLYR